MRPRDEGLDDVVLLPKAIDNSQVVREVDPRSNRDLFWLLFLVAALVAGMGLYAWPHFELREAAKATEKMRQEREKLLEENRKLRLEKAVLEDVVRRLAEPPSAVVYVLPGRRYSEIRRHLTEPQFADVLEQMLAIEKDGDSVRGVKIFRGLFEPYSAPIDRPVPTVVGTSCGRIRPRFPESACVLILPPSRDAPPGYHCYRMAEWATLLAQ